MEITWTPEVIACRSNATFRAVLDNWGGVSSAGSRTFKLNLGCSDKILPGYVNVDIAESRGNVKPEILCDLRRLSPIAENSADQVLSVRVVARFWRREVMDVLKE